jgi:hypothetical protein
MKEILLLEYEKLKDEQRVRISFRENLFYIALIVVGAVFSTLLTMPVVDFAYLALTPVLFIISNAYYNNDEIIARMNIYVRESLAPRLAAATGLKAEELFQWEGFTRSGGRPRRRLYQLAANLMLYPGASSAALAFFVSRRMRLSQAETIGVFICVLITALMLIQVLHYADVLGRKSK